ncbi:MAG TPA: hypothetical protein VES40_00835 [Ilumatobacteraceae bacterium]|nr:hypothetical protein [Ilumatobacteraceae bacterium]
MVEAPVISLRVGDVPAGMVDDWGRDPSLVATVLRLANLRWDVSVGGSQHLPRREGALIVVNARRFALSPIYAALALAETLHQPVRFVGRPDTAPVGAFSRRIGGLLDHPEEVAGALAGGQLVVMGAEHGAVGRVDHTLVGAALSVGVSVYPAATSSSPLRRGARLEIGPPSKTARKRRGPLSELELADQVRVDIATLLDELGELHTGTPLDWLPLSGLGGA